jgi:heme/copper-type cytochrome/quinol oxidase subunit 2
MFAHMIDGFKEKAGSALQLTSLATAVAVAGFVALSFLCAAAFVYVLQTYGLIQACLTGAGIFLVVALVAAGFYVVRRNKAQARAAEAARSAVHTALADPMLVAAGIQVVRAIGVKRLIPILAVGGLALGLLASRHASADEAPAE